MTHINKKGEDDGEKNNERYEKQKVVIKIRKHKIRESKQEYFVPLLSSSSSS